MSETTTCSDCERCTWNPGPDCGRPEHDHCPTCGHCGGRHSIRTWLHNTADCLMRDGDAEVTPPQGVLRFTIRRDTEAVEVDDGGPFRTTVPGPTRITFVAELENGNTIETVR